MRFEAYDGSSFGPADAHVHPAAEERARTPVHRHGTRRPRARPGLRGRRPRRRRRPSRRPVRRASRRSGTWRLRRPVRARDRVDGQGDGLAEPGPARAARRRRPCPAGAVPQRAFGTHGAATRTRSTTTTTCRTSSTRWCSDPRWRTPARFSPSRTPASRRPRRRSSTWWPASSGSAPACGCSTSAAAGAGCPCTRPSTTACTPSASRSPRSRPPGAPRRCGARGCPTGSRSCTPTTATRPASDYDAVSSIGLLEHVGVRNYPSYFGYLREQAARRRPAAQPLHHPADERRFGQDRSVHRPVRVPRRRADRVREDHHRAQDAGIEVRHEENLREHYALTLEQWCANLRDNWDACVARGRRVDGAGVGTLHGRVAAGVRAQRDPAPPGARRQGPGRAGDAGFPLRPTWGS